MGEVLEPSRDGRCNTYDPMEGRPADDGELFARAQRGDAAAFEEIVRIYQQVAFRTAYVITGSAADAEDATQEGFAKAYRALATFRAGAEPRPWLLRIVANEARNRVRSAGRRHQLELRLAEGFRPGGAAPSPEAEAVAAEDRQRLLSLVNELSEEDQLVIASRYFLELSGEETAAALGIAEGTVKSRLSRALTRLRSRAAEVFLA
jgi:RNA polymerase sigma factor (sigma-70 family)